MPRIVSRTERAKEDLLDILLYIAERSGSSATARKFSERLDDRIEFLAQFPEAGALYEEPSFTLRTFVVGEYLIYYRPIQGGIEVIRVL